MRLAKKLKTERQLGARGGCRPVGVDVAGKVDDLVLAPVDGDAAGGELVAGEVHGARCV
jgi:hypothetical protein